MKSLLPFVIISHDTHAKTRQALEGAVRVIKNHEATIADLRTGHANYEVTLQGMKDYTESFLAVNQERQRELDQCRQDNRALRFKLDQIDGVISSLASETRFSRRIAAILDATVVVTPVPDQAHPFGGESQTPLADTLVTKSPL